MIDHIGPILVVVCWPASVFMVGLGVLKPKAAQNFLVKRPALTILLLAVYALLSGGNMIWEGVTDWADRFHWAWGAAASINGVLTPGIIAFVGWRARKSGKDQVLNT